MALDAPHSTPVRPGSQELADLATFAANQIIRPESTQPEAAHTQATYGRDQFEADAKLRLQLRAATDQLEKASEDAKLRMEVYAFLCGEEFDEKQDLGFATVKWTASKGTVMVNGDKKRVLENLLKDPDYAHLVKLDFDVAAVQAVLEKNQDRLTPYGVAGCMVKKYIDVRAVQPKQEKP